VAATLLERSSAYAELPCTAGWDSAVYLFSNAYRREVTRAGAEWARTGVTPQSVQTLWNELRELENKEVTTESFPIVIRLMAIADEASIGIGFASHGKNAWLPSYCTRSSRFQFEA
jgi:hypothetical protein